MKKTDCPDDIIAMRIADGDWEESCYVCPAHDVSRRRKDGVEVECELLRAIIGGRIAEVVKKMKRVKDGFNGDSPQCGPLESAMALGRSVAQIRSWADNDSKRTPRRGYYVEP